MLASPVATTCFKTRKAFEACQMSFDIDQILRDLIRPGENVSEVTDEQAYKFVVLFFEESFDVLKSKERPLSEHQEVLDWVFEPPFAHLIDGREVIRVETVRCRFSFRWCCKLFGYDPDRFQQATIDTLLALDGISERQRALYEAYRAKLITLDYENLWSSLNAQ